MNTHILSNPGFVGGIIGSFFGVIGSVVGFYFSWKSAKTSKEKSMMITLTLAILGLVAAILSVQFLCRDATVKIAAWIVYVLFLGGVTVYGNHCLVRSRTK